jgi:hypothetical protein
MRDIDSQGPLNVILSEAKDLGSCPNEAHCKKPEMFASLNMTQNL